MRWWGILRWGLLANCAVLPASATETSTYTYDALGRLITTTNTGGPRSGNTVQSRYDPAGNRGAFAVNQNLPSENTAVTFSLSGPNTVTKGDKAVFQIAKSGPMAVGTTITLNYATTDGSAASPADYLGGSATLTFRPWETLKTLPIQTTDNGLSSPQKQFSVTISSASVGSTIATNTAGATIASSLGTKPVANPDFDEVGICSGKVINVTLNDTDPYGGYPLTVVSVTSATLGSATIVSASSIRFLAFGGVGGDEVTYTVRNTAGYTATAKVQVDIRDLGGCQ